MWSLISGSYFLKHRNDSFSFQTDPVHPVNMGVLAESVVNLDEQECFCHCSYPTLTRLEQWLIDAKNPRTNEIVKQLEDSADALDRDGTEDSYFHQMVVGGMSPWGSNVNNQPQAAGIVQVFPLPRAWRPQQRKFRTYRHC